MISWLNKRFFTLFRVEIYRESNNGGEKERIPISTILSPAYSLFCIASKSREEGNSIASEFLFFPFDPFEPLGRFNLSRRDWRGRNGKWLLRPTPRSHSILSNFSLKEEILVRVSDPGHKRCISPWIQEEKGKY